MEDRPGFFVIYKGEYCQGNNFSCARHMVKVDFEKEKFPFNLYPNQVEIAKKIIKENK